MDYECSSAYKNGFGENIRFWSHCRHYFTRSSSRSTRRAEAEAERKLERGFLVKKNERTESAWVYYTHKNEKLNRLRWVVRRQNRPKFHIKHRPRRESRSGKNFVKTTILTYLTRILDWWGLKFGFVPSKFGFRFQDFSNFCRLIFLLMLMRRNFVWRRRRFCSDAVSDRCRCRHLLVKSEAFPSPKRRFHNICYRLWRKSMVLCLLLSRCVDSNLFWWIWHRGKFWFVKILIKSPSEHHEDLSNCTLKWKPIHHSYLQSNAIIQIGQKI